ncbi:PREDICTED: uncharacterized protein LOC106101494 [Papilio polytes]|uniref:uncharacterized protein LOC106101494 n=1 Tax=Papilio polytes TaxID=76194 RepID=UPI000676A922|nr:PREDICTED: uncharacterized protein LOC106101494 [Papilio polytes]
MALRQLLIVVAFATLVCSIETDDIEHKKRGAGKTTGVNTIPTGIQKPDYTYAIYTQNPNIQSSTSQSYQAQVPNSFYPNQANSQYYSPVSSNEGTHSNSPQANPPHQGTSQFVPLNFIPNPGYQAKYQIVPTKSANGIQLALVQPSSGYSPQNLHASQPAVYPQPANQVNPHNNQLVSSVFPHGHFNFPNYQLSLGSPYLSQAPTILLPQLNHPFYNNLLYSSPGQNIYYPTNSQTKYNQNSPTSTTNEYDKLQGPVSQSNSKESNDIAAQHSENSISGYKNAYTSGRSQTYTKLT